MARLDYDIKVDGDALLATLSGSLDASNAPELGIEMDKALEDQSVKKVIWEISGLKILASAGLRVIMTGFKAAMSRGGKFYLVKPTGNIQSIIRIAGLDKFLVVADSIEECRA